MGEQVRKSVILMQCGREGMHWVLWKFKECVGRNINSFGARHVKRRFHLNSVLEDLRRCWGQVGGHTGAKGGRQGRKHDAMGSHARVCGLQGRVCIYEDVIGDGTRAI